MNNTLRSSLMIIFFVVSLQVCNKRLLECALTEGLPPFIQFPFSKEANPFYDWAPALLQPTKLKRRVVHYKKVSDVVEALLGAFLLDGGPRAANAFLR